MIWANAMWLISILLSLTSAMIATLPQQWARRYVEMPIRRGIPNHCAGARSFLFLGTEIYKILFAIQMAQTPMHLSVYLFFAGLVVVFRTINKSGHRRRSFCGSFCGGLHCTKHPSLP